MAEVAAKARFDRIRYAQAWEDADVLCAAMGARAGGRLLSVCASGDNALALLTLDPVEVVAVDLSDAQLACLRIRVSALRRLDDDAYLGLLGVEPSPDRGALLDAATADLSDADRATWEALRPRVVRHGLANVGRFEGYFRLFRRAVLPLVHSRATVAEAFRAKGVEGRRAFHDGRWDTWRWRLMLRGFFSNSVMGRLGRDPAFFAHVGGSLPDHVAARVRHAAVDLEPSRNPYMRQILTGKVGDEPPLPWRRENLDVIRSRTDRLTLVHGDVSAAASRGPFDGHYLSDVFEYMSEPEAEATYRTLVDASSPGARLVYWNMMVPRSRPASLADRVDRLDARSDGLGAADRAFFYSAFHVDVVR